MKNGRAKEIFDIVVGCCSIVSCVVAVVGVFQVVDFVIDVKPIIVPIAQEVKEGNMDARELFSGTTTAIRHDTVRVYQRDTIYLPPNEARRATTDPFLNKFDKEARPTAEEEQRLDHSADNVSKQERQKIDNEEASFRQRMRNKLNQH